MLFTGRSNLKLTFFFHSLHLLKLSTWLIQVACRKLSIYELSVHWSAKSEYIRPRLLYWKEGSEQIQFNGMVINQIHLRAFISFTFKWIVIESCCLFAIDNPLILKPRAETEKNWRDHGLSSNVPWVRSKGNPLAVITRAFFINTAWL